jgi:hypothetical protein
MDTMALIEFIAGLVLFAVLLFAVFRWLDSAHLSDTSHYDTPLADAPSEPAEGSGGAAGKS